MPLVSAASATTVAKGALAAQGTSPGAPAAALAAAAKIDKKKDVEWSLQKKLNLFLQFGRFQNFRIFQCFVDMFGCFCTILAQYDNLHNKLASRYRSQLCRDAIKT